MQRYTVRVREYEWGAHVEAMPDDDGAWVLYEDAKELEKAMSEQPSKSGDTQPKGMVSTRHQMPMDGERVSVVLEDGTVGYATWTKDGWIDDWLRGQACAIEFWHRLGG